jgi:hypothetical protein
MTQQHPPRPADSGPFESAVRRRLPVWRIGVAGGLVGMLCCVGPTVLALFGVIGAGTAYAWAEEAYGGYTWWLRLAGLVLMAALVYVGLRRRRMCSVAGVRRLRWRLLAMLGIAVITYVILYAVTTWLGYLAR